jgi:tRNA(Arg) A34 adenosine deaminase TadA
MVAPMETATTHETCFDCLGALVCSRSNVSVVLCRRGKDSWIRDDSGIRRGSWIRAIVDAVPLRSGTPGTPESAIGVSEAVCKPSSVPPGLAAER